MKQIEKTHPSLMTRDVRRFNASDSWGCSGKFVFRPQDVQEHTRDVEHIKVVLNGLKWEFSDAGSTDNEVVWNKIENALCKLGLGDDEE